MSKTTKHWLPVSYRAPQGAVMCSEVQRGEVGEEASATVLQAALEQVEPNTCRFGFLWSLVSNRLNRAEGDDL